MTGRFLPPEREPRHPCSPPAIRPWFRRWLEIGQRWQCDTCEQIWVVAGTEYAPSPAGPLGEVEPAAEGRTRSGPGGSPASAEGHRRHRHEHEERSMTEDYCKKYDMAASGCAHCRGHAQSVEEQAAAEDKQVAQELAGKPGWIEAQYGGRCACCGDGFGPGTMIKMFKGDWAAQCCAERVA